MTSPLVPGLVVFFCGWISLLSQAAPPRIVVEPQDQTNVLGNAVSFAAEVEGTAPLIYQWRAYLGTSFTNVPDATAATLTLSNIQTTSRRFALVVTNLEGSVTSRLASVVVLRPPIFAVDPPSTILREGAPTILAATVGGNSPFRYQWFKNGEPLPGATNANLAIKNAGRATEGAYVLQASNAYGVTQSRPAQIRVIPPPTSLEAHVLSDDLLTPIPYRLFVPTNGATGPFPLVMALHGSGEIGVDNISQLQSWPEPMVFISFTNQTKFPLLFVAPQCPPGSEWSQPAVESRLFDLIDRLVKEYPVDTNRIYVTGLSLGGIGSWYLPAVRPDFFAAAIPIAGGGPSSSARDFRNLAVWNFHSAIDGTVPVDMSRQMIAAVRAAGGRPIYTEYAQGGHAIWAQAWATPGLVEWTLAQRRGVPSPLPPDLSITNPLPLSSTGLISTTTTNVSLSGSGRFLGENLSSVTWSNLVTRRGGRGVVNGQSWSVSGLNLQSKTTNAVLLTAATYSFAPELGGITTVNALVGVLVQPKVSFSLNSSAHQVVLEWTGESGAYRLQTASRLDVPDWTDLVAPASSPQQIPIDRFQGYFRVVAE